MRNFADYLMTELKMTFANNKCNKNNCVNYQRTRYIRCLVTRKSYAVFEYRAATCNYRVGQKTGPILKCYSSYI